MGFVMILVQRAFPWLAAEETGFVELTPQGQDITKPTYVPVSLSNPPESLTKLYYHGFHPSKRDGVKYDP